MSEAEKGQEGARTRVDAAEIPQIEALAAALQQADPAPLLPGLDGPPPAETLDLVGRAAEQLNAVRRARGRPAGTANKRNSEVFDYLEARGFKQPELQLMEIISADPRALAAALAGPDVKPDSVSFDRALDVLKVQLAAARELMPYKFAKRHETKVAFEGKLGIMVAGQLSVQQTDSLLANGQLIDITGQSQTEE